MDVNDFRAAVTVASLVLFLALVAYTSVSYTHLAVCIPLALAGWLPPWAAGLGMAVSSLVVVLNALRAAR